MLSKLAEIRKALGAIVAVAGSLEGAEYFVNIDQYVIGIATALTAGIVFLIPNADKPTVTATDGFPDASTVVGP